MKATFELIQYNHNIPAKIELINGIISCLPHWHKEIELVFVFSGELTLTVKKQRHLLHADDVFLINAKEIHQISGEAEYLCFPSSRVNLPYLSVVAVPYPAVSKRTDGKGSSAALSS